MSNYSILIKNTPTWIDRMDLKHFSAHFQNKTQKRFAHFRFNFWKNQLELRIVFDQNRIQSTVYDGM